MKTDSKMVSIKLFKDNQAYSGDVFASVNGENYLIKRGVTVEVPDYIAEVLDNSRKEDENAVARMEKAERSYLDKVNAIA